MTILKLHSETLQSSWIDAYGHLNQAYYLVPFSNASWILQDMLGVGRKYFEATGCAIYTAASLVNYRREVKAPALLQFETVITEVGQKKFAFAHRMLVDDQEATIFETIVVHVDTKIKKSVPFPEGTYEELKRLRVRKIPNWVTGGLSTKRVRTPAQASQKGLAR